ncbi:FAD-dependent oxidoreductase, partial [Escherichia sp. HC-CC]
RYIQSAQFVLQSSLSRASGYPSGYRMHQIALHGYFKTGLMMLVGSINRVIRPRLKLH